MVGQRVVHDGVLRHFGQRDVLAHVIQIRAVVLAHDEKLARVAEHGGADARLLEARILLHDGNVPAIELAKLGVGFLDDFLPAGNVEETGDLLVDVPFPNGARQRHDVLARVVRDEEAGGSLQFLRGLRDVAQLEVRDFAGERKIARAVEQTAVVSVATPRQNQRGDFHDLVALCADGVEHHQLLKHPVRRKFIRRKVCKGEIADFLAGPGSFRNFNTAIPQTGADIPPLRTGGLLSSRGSPQKFRGWSRGRHFFSAKVLQRHRVPGDVEQLVVPLLLPVLERILVKQVQVFGNLRLAEHLFVLLT